MPKNLTIDESISALSLNAPLDIVAAPAGESEGSAKTPSRFSLVGYTGTAMNVGWGTSVVIDLSGIDVGDGVVPILLDHDNSLESVFGQSETIKVVDGQLVAAGKIFDGIENERVARAISLAKRGLRLQASVGATNQKVLFYDDDESVIVNGKEFSGPVYVVAKSTLREISVVVLGADGKTSTDISAKQKEGAMPKNLDPEPNASTESPAARNQPPQVNEDELIAKGRNAERQRIADLTACFAGEFPEMLAQAISEGWDENKANREILAQTRASKTTPPPCNSPEVFHGQRSAFDNTAVQAALCLAGNLPDIDKVFGEKNLEAAHKRWGGRGCGLQEVILECARANGYNGRLRVTSGNYQEVMRYAMGCRPDGINAAYFSSLSLPEAFAGTMNRFLMSGYESIEKLWPEISQRRPVSDFRDYKGIRVSSLDVFEDVGPKGELKHGRPPTEQSYTNSVERKGRILGIADTDIINDDLGILTNIPTALGMAAARTLNRIAWGTFNDNTAFFNSTTPGVQQGDLNPDTLKTAITKFRGRKDPTGESYDLSPKIILVGPDKEWTAKDILSEGVDRIVDGKRTIERRNQLAGNLKLIVSDRITGPEWYLLADPRVATTLEMAFLDGKETPTIEQASAPFDVLGIQFRAYLDAGACLVDPMAGIKFNGITP